MTLLNKLRIENNKLTKLTAAIILSLGGAISSMSALAMATDNEVHKEVREISIEAEHGKNVKLFVDNNGDMVNVSIPHSALSDESQLAEYLQDVPEDVREKLLNELSNLSENLFVLSGSKGHGEEMRWVTSGDSDNMIIIENDGDHKLDIEKHIIKEFTGDGEHKVFKFKHGGDMKASAIISMLEFGKFSADELDKIQQALDAKR